MTNKLVASLLVSVLLIVSLLTGSGASQSLRVTEQPQDGDTPASALTFSIELNVRVLYQIHHSRMIVVFVEPQSCTLANITSLVRELSEAHTSEEDLAIWFISDKELLAKTIADLGDMIKPFPFGNVFFPKFHCASPYHPPLYAEYFRGNSTEDLRYYPAAGDGILHTLRYPSADDAPSGDTAIDLVDASMRGIDHLVKELLEKGADPNIKTKYGESVLIEAAFWGNHEILRLLLDAGAEINQTSSTGWTALMATAYGNRYKSFELLLDRGADINMRSQDGRTALILAVRQRHTNIVERLLSLGADPNVIDGYGETPLGLAKEANYADLICLLEQAGAR